MDYIVSANDISTLNSAGVTLKVNGVPAFEYMEVYNGDTLVATTIPGKEFVDIYFHYEDEIGQPFYGYFALNANKTEATYTLEPPMPWEPYVPWDSLQMTTVDAVPDYVYFLTQNDIDALNANGVELRRGEEVLGLGSGISYGDELTATVSEGRVFYLDTFGEPSIYFTGEDEGGGPIKIPFTLSNNNTVATVTFEYDNPFDLELTWLSLVPNTQQVDSVVGSNNVYVIDAEKLVLLNSERFVSSGNTVFDYGEFILSVILVPFSVDSSEYLEPENVRLANLQTDVIADKLKTDLLKVDLGEISIPNDAGNLLDYANVTAILHLPRIPPMNISLDCVIGETIGIEYLIDCYTGNATVNITSSKIDGVIVTTSVDLGINIPHSSIGSTTSVHNSNIEVGGDNGVKIPYIELKKNDAVLPYGFFTIPIVDEDTIGNQNGFVQVEQIELQTNANSSEAQQIRAILANGVIIK